MNNHIINSVNVSISKEEKRLQNWSIPKEPLQKSYQIGNLNLFKNYNINTKSPQEGPKAGRDTALALSFNGPNNGQLVNRRPVGEVKSISN